MKNPSTLNEIEPAETFDDALTEVCRIGARKMLAECILDEVEAFILKPPGPPR